MEPDCESLSEIDDDACAPLGEKLGGSETTSIGSHLSLNSLSKSSKISPSVILRHVILKGISSQIVSATVSNHFNYLS